MQSVQKRLQIKQILRNPFSTHSGASLPQPLEADMAHRTSFLYGIVAVLVALTGCASDAGGQTRWEIAAAGPGYRILFEGTQVHSNLPQGGRLIAIPGYVPARTILRGNHQWNGHILEAVCPAHLPYIYEANPLNGAVRCTNNPAFVFRGPGAGGQVASGGVVADPPEFSQWGSDYAPGWRVHALPDGRYEYRRVRNGKVYSTYCAAHEPFAQTGQVAQDGKHRCSSTR